MVCLLACLHACRLATNLSENAAVRCCATGLRQGAQVQPNNNYPHSKKQGRRRASDTRNCRQPCRGERTEIINLSILIFHQNTHSICILRTGPMICVSRHASNCQRPSCLSAGSIFISHSWPRTTHLAGGQPVGNDGNTPRAKERTQL